MALLGLAENFLKPSPNHPGFKVNPAGVLPAIKCLGAIFRLNPRPLPPIEARTHLQLGALLKRETQNVDMAKQHLEQAVSVRFFKLQNSENFNVKVRYSFFFVTVVSKSSSWSTIGRRSIRIWLPFGRNLLRGWTDFTVQANSSRGHESVPEAFVLALPATFSISGNIILLYFHF